DFINELPIELAYHTLGFLDSAVDLINASQVSRKWHLVATDNLTWKSVFMNHPTWHSHRGIDWRARYIDRVALTKRWQHARHVSMRYLLGHTDSVYCLQFDRRKLVTGSRDRTIKIWDMNTWKCTQTLYGHDASVLCLKYDAQQMVTGSSDSSVIVWDAVDQPGTAGSFKPAYQLKSHSAGVLDVSFNDDYIVSCSKDLSIKVWSREQLPPDATAAIMDLPSLPLLRTLTGHRGPVNALQLRSNRIVSASGDATIRMWDPDSGQCLHEYTGHGRGLACVQFDGRRIVSGSNDQTIKVWDAETGKCLQTLTGHTDLVRTLHYPGELEYPGGSVSGGKLVSGSYDQTVKVWDIDSGKCLLDLRIGHSSWVFDVQLSHSKIISSSQDSKVLVHDF
ncbi:WD40 repeat-like protein, partial [Ramicandelaber brevisporus]